MTKTAITGVELKAARKLSGLSQTKMGERIGFSRHAISYWENQARPISGWKAQHGLLRAYLHVLGLTVLRPSNTSMRARGGGVLQYWDQQQLALDQAFAQEWARIKARNVEKAARQRVRCGAKTRKGHACRNMSEAGRRRCKFHGGKSTGPITAVGKARIAAAQRNRWEKWRILKTVWFCKMDRYLSEMHTRRSSTCDVSNWLQQVLT
jgi:transcriptional regulator with XRE-family HTH domain